MMKKKVKNQHLVFYDGQCGLCDQVVRFLIKADHQERFVFAPLQGKTAMLYLNKLPLDLKNKDSLILIQNYRSSHAQLFFLAKGVLKISWLLGGGWSLIGSLSFFPSFLFNWAYRLIARYRYRFFSNPVCMTPLPHLKHRFLP